ncbi:MAG TPA: kelch repeat-containing protein [Terracidiphilus sp.]|nr:kelch repeat-containing protein [Terracidiphilus sp.]
MKRYLLALPSIGALCLLSACSTGPGGTKNGGVSAPQVATHFAVTAPAVVSAGGSFTISVSALDSSGNVVTGYSGTVLFTSTDPEASLPGHSILIEGKANFDVSLMSSGKQTVTATDSVTAGITGSSSPIQVVVVSTHGFQPSGEMGSERAAHTATVLANGKVLIAGGYDGTEVLATAELFDPATGTFTPTGAMNTPRFQHTATLLSNGKVLITGGTNSLAWLSGAGEEGDLATAELFDPDTGTFAPTGTMSEVRIDHTATLLANGKVLVAGGTADNVAELFDPATNSFSSTTGQLITGGRWGCTATLLNDGRVLIAGGRDDENWWDALPLEMVELFDPTTETFTAANSMAGARFDHTATLLQNGEVLLAGGFNGQPIAAAELFDPASGSFSTTGTMNVSRAEHTATLLGDGTVLLTGGFTYATPGSISSAEVFDPAANMFVPAGSMSTGRFSHAAALLNNGEVLITGGVSNDSPPEVITSSSELY